MRPYRADRALAVADVALVAHLDFRSHWSLVGTTPDQAYFNELRLPLGNPTPAETSLIEAENLSRQPGPALNMIRSLFV
jgi:hypothetical protein